VVRPPTWPTSTGEDRSRSFTIKEPREIQVVTHTQSLKYTQSNTPSVLQREFPHSLTRAHLSFESLSLHSLEEALFFIQEAISSSYVGWIARHGGMAIYSLKVSNIFLQIRKKKHAALTLLAHSHYYIAYN
jgi:hypothetical protein